MSNQRVIGIDIGNSAIKTAEFFASEIGETTRWKDLDTIASRFTNARFVISSVGISNEEITEKLKNSLMLDAQTPLPISLNYDTPKTLGSDRIAAAVGAWKLFPQTNILIVDSGTCMTYDLVTSAGVFQGGMISPGFDMRLQAMHQFTHSLPLLDSVGYSGTSDIVGKSTKECIWQGAKKGLCFEIEGVLEFFAKKYDHLQVIMTGGSVSNFESITKACTFAGSKIVLSGLHAIWKFNEDI